MDSQSRTARASVDERVGDWSIFRPADHTWQENVGRKHGPVPLALAGPLRYWDWSIFRPADHTWQENVGVNMEPSPLPPPLNLPLAFLGRLASNRSFSEMAKRRARWIRGN
jgi:hypothetical protein